jgi:DNA-binding LytR/AlgR family response regulator
VLTLHNEAFIFAEALENYCEIYFYEVDKIKKLIIRSTISNIAEQLKPNEAIFKCHRSYVVNLNLVENVIGNVQGSKIKLKNIENQIPVSRTLIKEFKNKWMNKNN